MDYYHYEYSGLIVDLFYCTGIPYEIIVKWFSYQESKPHLLCVTQDDHTEIHHKWLQQIQLECAASNGNRYPLYPQVKATAISQ